MGWFEDRFTYSERKTELCCPVCSGKFWLPPSKAGRYKRCSPECIEAHAEAVKKSKVRACLCCNSEFSPRVAQVKKGQGKYCSLKCSATSPAMLESWRSPEAARKRLDAFNRSVLEGRVVIRSGPDHPQWTGGKDASLKRRRDSGVDSIRAAAYKKRNPEKARDWKKKRGAGYLSKLPRGTTQRIGDSQKWKCAICKVSVRGSFHVDHVMPIALGGLHEPLNIQILCPTCNMRKNAKHPVDYMQERGFLL